MTTNQTSRETHELKVEMTDEVWRVTKDGNPYPVVGQGDTVTWKSSSKLVFQFPPNFEDFFLKPEGYDFDVAVCEEELEVGNKLTLVVRDDAPFGRIFYSVLVKKDCVFAQGGSEPAIIFKDY